MNGYKNQVVRDGVAVGATPQKSNALHSNPNVEITVISDGVNGSLD